MTGILSFDLLLSELGKNDRFGEKTDLVKGLCVLAQVGTHGTATRMAISDVLHDYYIALLCFGAALALLTMVLLYRACSDTHTTSDSSSSSSSSATHHHNTTRGHPYTSPETQPLVKRGVGGNGESPILRIDNVVDQV